LGTENGDMGTENGSFMYAPSCPYCKMFGPCVIGDRMVILGTENGTKLYEIFGTKYTVIIGAYIRFRPTQQMTVTGAIPSMLRVLLTLQAAFP
jgi:hypothetical protein